MKPHLLIAAAAATLSAAAFAQEPAPEDIRINQLIIYGDDTCPQSTDDEIVVCAKLPEDDRFRIPEELREGPGGQKSRSWADRAIELNYVGQSGIGSCSTSGPGGASGCFDQIMRQAQAERAGRSEVNWNRLIEEARQERLGRIDEESEAIEQELRDE